MTCPRRLLVPVTVSTLLVFAGCSGGDGSKIVVGTSTSVSESAATSDAVSSTAVTSASSTAVTSAPGTTGSTSATTKAASAATTLTPAPGTGSTVVGSASGSHLRRRDVPPEGVATQLSPPLAFTDGCDSDPSAPLAVAANNSALAVGDSTLVCVNGSADGPVTVHVRLPDGLVRQLPDAGEDGATDLHVAVLDPLGSYEVTATQGPRRATTRVSVSLPRRPVLETLDPAAAPPGTTFRFAIASPAPGQTVELDLYRGRMYATTLPAARTDGSARLVYQLATLPDDPAGSYCIQTRPHGSCAHFQIT